MNPWSLIAVVFVATVIWDIGRRWVRSAHADNELETRLRRSVDGVDARVQAAENLFQARIDRCEADIAGRLETLEDGAKKHQDEFRSLMNRLTSARTQGAPRGIGRTPG